MAKSFVLALIMLSSMAFCADHKEKSECITQEKVPVVPQDVRIRICEWALQEMIERQQEETAGRKKEARHKWIAAGIGVVTTITPLVITILEMSKSEECPTSQSTPPSNNSTG